MTQEKVFSDTFSTTALAVYDEFESAEALANMDLHELTDLSVICPDYTVITKPVLPIQIYNFARFINISTFVYPIRHSFPLNANPYFRICSFKNPSAKSSASYCLSSICAWAFARVSSRVFSSSSASCTLNSNINAFPVLPMSNYNSHQQLAPEHLDRLCLDSYKNYNLFPSSYDILQFSNNLLNRLQCPVWI